MRLKTIRIIQAKFLVMLITLYSISSLAESEKPSHCSELYGCQTTDPQEKIVKQNMYNETLKDALKKNEINRKESLRKIKDYNNKVKKKTVDENLNQALIKCKDLGFKEGTEKFGECVLKLSE